MDDLISRQQALDALAKTAREAFNLSEEYGQYLAGLMDGENALRQLPSAQPERMRAIWKCRELKYDMFKTYDFVCSACGKCPPLNYNKEMLLSDFCPNCGADMRGKQDAGT